MPWRVGGYDSFAHEEYTFQGEYATEEEARAAAAEHLESIMRLQPKANSGGTPLEGGIQDMVFVVRPDGSKYRFDGEK